jgi:hypothetical protein
VAIVSKHQLQLECPQVSRSKSAPTRLRHRLHRSLPRLQSSPFCPYWPYQAGTAAAQNAAPSSRCMYGMATELEVATFMPNGSEMCATLSKTHPAGVNPCTECISGKTAVQKLRIGTEGIWGGR